MSILESLSRHKHKIIAGIVMALVVATPYALILREQHAKQTTLKAASTCTPDAELVNPCHPWLGAWAASYPQPGTGTKNQIEYHESRIGRPVDIVKDYSREGGQLTADDKYFVNRANTYLLMTWKPSGSFGAGASSSAYGSIDTMANSIKSVAPHKVFLSVWHEPENDVSPGTTGCANAKGNAGSPAQYRAMWQNVHDRFAADGANNVVWTYIPMGYSGWNCMEKDMWPGNNLVNWVMWDPYGNGDNDSWDKTISPFYTWMTANTDAAHAYTSKQWGIAETSIHWNSLEISGVNFWKGAKAALDANTYPRLKAYLVFDSDNGKPDNRIDYWCKAWTNLTCNAGQLVADPAKQSAYAAFANDPLFSSGGGGTTDTTPPVVSITGPAGGATVSGTISLSAKATDNVGVSRISFSVDNKQIASGTASSVSINTFGYSDGTHTLAVTATDAAGNGQTVQESVTIKNAPIHEPVPPVLPVLSADKTKVMVGGSVLLSWSAPGATGCVLNPGAVTSTGSTGSKLITNLQQTTTFTITCSNGQGSVSAPLRVEVTQTVAVTNPLINSFTAQPNVVTAGGVSHLQWSTSNVATNGCSITPGPLTSAAASGEWQTPVLQSSVSYTLTCKDTNGNSVHQSVGITVNGVTPPPAPAATGTSAQPTVAAVVKAAGGQQVVNAQAQDTVKAGQLVTLDPSNVLDAAKSRAIMRVEYYNGDKLVQTVSSAPFALDTKAMSPGMYTLTERTFYADGSNSERTQDITVQSSLAAAKKKPASGMLAVWLLLVAAAVIGGFLILRRVLEHRALAAETSLYTQSDAPMIIPDIPQQQSPQQPQPYQNPQDAQQPPYDPRQTPYD